MTNPRDGMLFSLNSNNYHVTLLDIEGLLYSTLHARVQV